MRKDSDLESTIAVLICRMPILGHVAGALCVVYMLNLTGCDAGESAPPPSGCQSPTAPEAAGTLRFAAGAVAESRPLWGEGGILTGEPWATAAVTVVSQAGPGHVTVALDGEGAARSLSIMPGTLAGSGWLRVTMTDACSRPVVVDVPVELVNSPNCRLDFDPTSLDYFPVALGMRWRYEVNSNGNISQQTWELWYDSGCQAGSRTVRLIGAEDWEFVLRGDSVFQACTVAACRMRRFYPVESEPPETVYYSTGYHWHSRSLRRGVGVYSYSRGPRDHVTTWTLLEGPILPP